MYKRQFWYFAEEPGWSDATRTTLVRLYAPVATAEHAEQEPPGASHGACAAPPLPDVEGLGVPPTFKFYGDPPRAAAIARAMFAKLRGALALVAAREVESRVSSSRKTASRCAASCGSVWR